MESKYFPKRNWHRDITCFTWKMSDEDIVHTQRLKEWIAAEQRRNLSRAERLGHQLSDMVQECRVQEGDCLSSQWVSATLCCCISLGKSKISHGIDKSVNHSINFQLTNCSNGSLSAMVIGQPSFSLTASNCLHRRVRTTGSLNQFQSWRTSPWFRTLNSTIANYLSIARSGICVRIVWKRSEDSWNAACWSSEWCHGTATVTALDVTAPDSAGRHCKCPTPKMVSSTF